MTLESTPSQNRLELTSGNCRAVFLHDDHGWKPDWIYDGDVPVLRFKDHEWLSIGRVVYPTHAESMAEDGRGGAVFCGSHENVLGCRVNWRVNIVPTDDGWFRVEFELRPESDLILTEAMGSFECPYEYDGSEYSRVLLGANPASIWDGAERVTPPVYANPLWQRSRHEAARATYPTHLPLIIHEISGQAGITDRYVSMVADFNRCDLHDQHVTPTRTIRSGYGGYPGNFKSGTHRGYKYILGMGNWQSAYHKDPAYHVPAEGIRQVVEIRGGTEMPGGELHAWLIETWRRCYQLHGNTGRRPKVSDRYEARGVSWHAAAQWSSDALLNPGSTPFCEAERGPVDYLLGTRPVADFCYGEGWRQLFSGKLLEQLDYRIKILGREKEDRSAHEQIQQRLIDKGFADQMQSENPKSRRMAYAKLNRMQTLGMKGPLVDAMQKLADETPTSDMAKSFARVMCDDNALPGLYVVTAQNQIGDLSPETYAVWLPLLEAIAAGVDDQFWGLAYMPKSKMFITGGQSSPHTMLLAAEIFGQAYQVSGDDRWARYWRRLINLSVGWTVHCYRGHDVAPDVDYRGMCHACVSGRDQEADMPPMENTSLINALSLLDLMPEEYIERSWLDAAWMSRHTSLLQYPIARTHVRAYTGAAGSHLILPGEQVASHRYLQETVPYLAYENPIDQTMLATYQSLMCFPAELFWGNLIADAGPDVLTLCPRAVRLDPIEMRQRLVVVYNPREDTQEVDLRARFAGKEDVERSFTLEGRSWKILTIDAD